VRASLTRTLTGLLAGLLLVPLAGCTGEVDKPAPTSAPTPAVSTGAAPTLTPRAAPMAVRVTRVAGRLPAKSRASLERNVGRTLRSYVQAAYVDGAGSDYAHAFDTFSKDAARSARHDRRFLTGAALGEDAADGSATVVPVRQKAWLSVLAPNRVAAGVTARVLLDLLVDGDREDRLVRVEGRLLLTRKKGGGWQIFGYDVSHHTTREGSGR
jgi:hypothetical protein